ncbi:MAG: DNA internalization-related competence protein ComEC/Rec2 [Pseudomonadales bacterium]
MPSPVLPRRRKTQFFVDSAIRVGLALVLGVLLPVWCGSWSPWRWSLAAIALLSCRWSWGRLLCVVVLTGLCTSLRIDAALSAFRHTIATPATVTLSGKILSISTVSTAVTRFEFQVHTVSGPTESSLPGKKLRLSWYRAPPLANAQRWRMTVRLRPAHSLSNPGGFDYSRWLFAKGLVGVGTIQGGEQLLGQPEPWLERLRQQLASKLDSHVAGPVLRALLLGDRQAMQPKHWDTLRRSGTVHLFIVSGLHVALVAGLAASLSFALARTLSAVRCRGDGRWLAWAGAASCAAFYVLLTGAGLPALRAWLMAMSAGALYACGRVRGAAPVLLWTLCLLLLIDPLSALLPGTWLSFGAVLALLSYWQRQYGRLHPLSVLVRSQLILTIALAPTLRLFDYPLAPAGLLANLFAVPVVTLLVLPLGLLGSALALLQIEAAQLPIYAAGELTQMLLEALQRLNSVRLWWPQPSSYGVALALMLGFIGAYRPVGVWAMLIVSSLLLTLSIRSNPELAQGTFQIVTLDVGQGAAVLVQTRRHNLLFDAAPAYPGGIDLGSSVVVPALHRAAVGTLDALVISHSDSDHAGGAQAVRAEFNPSTNWASDASQMARICHVGQRWRWDGVWFEFVHPTVPLLKVSSANERSCVLHVRSRNASALLTGDISWQSEQQLLRRWYSAVDFLQIPHHGSIGSSSPAFVRLLRPKVAVVSAARFSRYRHPHTRIVQRYRDTGAKVEGTAERGALIWRSVNPWRLDPWGSIAVGYWKREWRMDSER